MSRRARALVPALAALVALVGSGCTAQDSAVTKPPPAVPNVAAAMPQSRFFNQADYDRQMAQRRLAPTGDPNTPWLQMIQPTMVDTSGYARHGKWHICFSNAGLGNPWRVAGFTTMKAEVKLHPEIGEFTVLDAGGKDDEQLADLTDLQTRHCNAVIVSPNTTDPLTPAVQKLCATGVPVIVFDRGIRSDCPVTFVHPIGGYAFGATDAEFVALKAGRGGKVLAMRLLPNVDVLEDRWAAAKLVFQREGVNVVGVEFNNADPVKAKAIVKAYLKRFGNLDGVWLDAGFASVTVAQTFQELGKPVPALDGEDQQDFLAFWQQEHLTAVAATYPVYQWRTAVIAAVDILSGKPVPKEWVLPQPVISSDTLPSYLTPGMPAEFYPTCGCQHMPGFPQEWGGR